MPTITMPDGVDVEFPDDMPSAHIKSLIASKFPDIAKGSADKPPPQEDVGQLRALGEGYLSGFSGNFRDEIYGASKASGLPDILGGFRAPVGAARLAYEKWKGEPGEATKTYDESVARMRGIQDRAKEQYPGTTLVGNIGGAVMLPGGATLKAATLPVRAARGAAVGGVYGAISGAGEGENLEDRAVKAATGAGVGLAAGAAAPVVVEGLIKGGSALASPLINTIRAARNPVATAERAIGRAEMEATRADPNAVNRLAVQELTPGSPATVMDTLGGPGRDLARSAANKSGEARDILNQTLDPRFQEQVPRLTNWLRQTFHYPDAHAQQLAIDQTEKTVNRANYLRAYKDGDKQLWSPELERLVSSPAVVEAMSRAAVSGKDRAVVQGFGGFNPGVTVQNGLVNFRRGPSGVPTYPNLQFWDMTRRELSDGAKAAQRVGKNDEASRLGDLARGLNAELDSMVPTYQQARTGASGFFKAENALEAGQNYVTQNFATPETRRALSKMSPQELKLFQDGFVSRFVEMLEKVPDRADVVRRVYNTPAAREKITVALGQQRSAELEAMLRVENIMQQGLRAVQGNSSTVLQLSTAGLAGAGGGGILGFDPTTSGLAAALATAGKKGIDQRVAMHVARMLTSNDPAIIQRGSQMIAKSQGLMNAIRSIDNATSRAVGQQTGYLPVSAPSVRPDPLGAQ